MLWTALVDKTGNGLWAATAVLYFTYVTGLTAAQVGILIAVSAGIGVAGAPVAGRLADRMSLNRLLIAAQLLRAAAGFCLLTTDQYVLLIAFAAAGSFGDRASSVLTKLYAARVAGPDRVRYQAVNRTVSNIGFAVGGLAAAAALGIGTTPAYQALVVGNGIAALTAALLIMGCGEAPVPARRTSGDSGTTGTTGPQKPAGPWRDRTYLLYTATEALLLLDDAVFKVGLPLWIVHATDAPHGLAPLLMVLNNVMVVALQIPLSRYGATSHAARRLLVPLAAAFAVGALALSLSTTGGAWTATVTLTVAAVALTFAEMLHATASWELSVALAPDEAQGAYLGVHGLANSAQRSLGPLVMTATVAAGPLGWALFGTGLATVCLAQSRLVRDRLPKPALSVPAATVSHE
ncbi:MFS transporter [Streptomyces peucetius]|uniref:MFS transporter n=2 Tax=Streptomyces peucetius TaxID=1950 RepID=A0ABY6IHB5_STRPE|nr:MFS transporter [Streptomyces peucetius]